MPSVSNLAADEPDRQHNAEVARLRSCLTALGVDDTDTATITPEECADMLHQWEIDWQRHGQLEADATNLAAEVARLKAITEYPCTALFVGREATENERHLLNLLSWREKEAKEAKEEVARVTAKHRDSWNAAARWGFVRARKESAWLCWQKHWGGDLSNNSFCLARDIEALPVVDLPEGWTPGEPGEGGAS